MPTDGLCTSFKAEILAGIHSPTDAYKMALYRSTSLIGPDTTNYEKIGEISGEGYVAGGKKIGSYKVVVVGENVGLQFEYGEWENATITARAALIYNSSKGNRAVCVLDFGSDKTSTNGPFRVFMPENGPVIWFR